jgi:polysaccharide deacetylase 2 family uncharacterized protein YibQ
MVIAERDVFIDNSPDRESMKRYIETGLVKAAQTGAAIMIGHAHTNALAPLLAELFPELSRQGYSFSTVSALLDNKK